MYKKIFIILGVILTIVVMGVLIMTYFVRINSPLIMTVRKALYLPAIVVDGHNISIKELEENTASIKHFYEAQNFSRLGIRIDFDTEDGQKRLKIEEEKMINKLIEDIAIKTLADEWNIVVSDDAVKAAMERPMEEMGSETDVEQKLQNLYGWSLDDFGKKVVQKQLLKEKVAAQFEQKNLVTQEMEQKIKDAKKELDDGRIFADVAMKYSEGSTAKEGGIMGWFADGQMQDEIGKQIFTMDKGQYTDIIETSLGLHIVHIDEIAEVENKKLVHISQIVIEKQTFADYVNEKIKTMTVKIFVPGYEWDKDKAMIIFSDEDMRQFKEKMLQESMKVQPKIESNNE